MKKIIVTTGQPFTDIDSLACAIAYAEFYNLIGIKALAVLPGPLNKSITEKIKAWGLEFDKEHKTSKVEKYVMVDISEPEYFATFVDLTNVKEIFDHRHGFEKYWKKKLKDNCHIEMVGSCATLIWEQFIESGLQKHISKVSANLLYTAIASNTLNFKASVTTERDVKAFEELKEFINLPEDWIQTYFSDQDEEVKNSISQALLSDTKIRPDYAIGQLELWKARKIIKNNLKEIEKTFLSINNSNWFLTSPSISEGKNYLYTKVPAMKKLLKKTINAKFDGDLGETNKLWLRKEIIAKLNDLSK